MKTNMAAMAGLVCLIGVSYLVGSAAGQGANKPAAAPPSKVALIDMAEVFRQYIKFQNLRDDLQAKIKAKDGEIQGIGKQMQALQNKLQSKEIEKGSDAYSDLEKQYVELGSKLEASRKQAQLELMREEAKNYHTVYQEVQGAVKTFAEHFGYTVVLRFNREEPDGNDPQKVIQGLGRQIVFHKADDDITDGVVEFINRGLKTAAKPRTDSEVKPTGGTGTTTPRPGAARPKTANSGNKVTE